jgi:hypothetical protein
MTTPGTTRAPIETKTKAATSATFVAGLALWVLSKYVFKGNPVPDVLQSWIFAVAPAVVTFVAAYLAPHTHRPDLPSAPALMPSVLAAYKAYAPEQSEPTPTPQPTPTFPIPPEQP